MDPDGGPGGPGWSSHQMGKDELEGGAALGTESRAGPDPLEQGPPPRPASAGRAAVQSGDRGSRSGPLTICTTQSALDFGNRLWQEQLILVFRRMASSFLQFRGGVTLRLPVLGTRTRKGGQGERPPGERGSSASPQHGRDHSRFGQCGLN